jgi:hypothetical protein
VWPVWPTQCPEHKEVFKTRAFTAPAFILESDKISTTPEARILISQGPHFTERIFYSFSQCLLKGKNILFILPVPSFMK